MKVKNTAAVTGEDEMISPIQVKNIVTESAIVGSEVNPIRITESAAVGLVISPSSYFAEPGSEITYVIKTNTVNAMMGFNLDLAYDTERLENPVITPGSLQPLSMEAEIGNDGNIHIAATSSKDASFTGEGTLAEIKLKVKDNASVGNAGLSVLDTTKFVTSIGSARLDCNISSVTVATSFGDVVLSTDKASLYYGEKAVIKLTARVGTAMRGFSGVINYDRDSLKITGADGKLNIKSIMSGVEFNLLEEGKLYVAVTNSAGFMGTNDFIEFEITPNTDANIEKTEFTVTDISSDAALKFTPFSVSLKSSSQKKVDDTNKLINAIGEITQENYTEKKAALDDAKKAYEALTEDEKTALGDAARAKLEKADASWREYSDNVQKANAVKILADAIGEVTQENYLEKESVINTAKAAYETLTEAQKSLAAESDRIIKAAQAKYNECADNKEKSDAATAVLNVLPTAVEANTEAIAAAQGAIANAEAAYNALTEIQKALVSSEAKSKLDAAKAAVKEAQKNLDDKTAAAAAEELLNALPTAVEANTEAIAAAQGAIANAEAAYNALTETQKALVSSEAKAKLDAAKAAVKEAQKNLDNKTAAAAAEELLNALPTVVEANTEAIAAAQGAIANAEAAYNALTETQKALVSSEAKSKLDAAKAAVENAYNAMKDIKVTVSKSDKSFTVTVDKQKTTEKDYPVIIAVKNGEGRLIKTVISSTAEKTITVDCTDAAVAADVYVWNSLGSMVPYSSVEVVR